MKKLISDNLRFAAEDLKLHEILRFKNKMTEEQIKKLIEKVVKESKNPKKDLMLLHSHDLLLKPEHKNILKIQNLGGWTPLHYLADQGVKEILNPEFKDMLKIQSNARMTPLHHLALYGVKEILNPEFKEALKIRNRLGKNPLHFLADQGVEEILNPEFKEALKIQDQRGRTPEDILKQRGRTAAEKLKLHEILRFKHKMTEEQLKKLQLKALEFPDNYMREERALLMHGQGIKIIPELLPYLTTALAKNGDTSIIEDPKYRTYLNTENIRGWNPLHHLADQGNTEVLKPIFKDLLKVRDVYGITPLHNLALRGKTEILKPEYMDILKVQDISGYTPLHYLADQKKTEILKPEYMGILRIQGKKGYTPLHFLARRGNTEILNPEYQYFLSEALKIRDSKGETPEDILKR